MQNNDPRLMAMMLMADSSQKKPSDIVLKHMSDELATIPWPMLSPVMQSFTVHGVWPTIDAVRQKCGIVPLTQLPAPAKTDCTAIAIRELQPGCTGIIIVNMPEDSGQTPDAFFVSQRDFLKKKGYSILHTQRFQSKKEVETDLGKGKAVKKTQSIYKEHVLCKKGL